MSQIPSTGVAGTQGAIFRELQKLKVLMNKRAQYRGTTLQYLSAANKSQLASVACRQLYFASTKVFREYSDDFNNLFQQTFFYRTSKAKEHVEYLLDSVIAFRVFTACKKRDDMIEVLDKLELGDYIDTNSITDKLIFNQQHEVHSKRCAIMLTFVQVAKAEKLDQFANKFFKQYLTYVKKYYGIFEYSTALFKYGNYLFEGKKFQEAQLNYQQCIDIRMKNTINCTLVKILINIAICQRERSKYQDAIKNTQIAISIFIDICNEELQLDDYYLFLSKLYLQNGDFQQAYKYLMICYCNRYKLKVHHPRRMQIQLILMFFFKTLKEVKENPKLALNTDLKMKLEQKKKCADKVLQMMEKVVLIRRDFSKFKDNEISKLTHLTINTNQELFQLLSSEHIEQLHNLLNKIKDLSYIRGVAQLTRSGLFKDKIIKEEIIKINPNLKNHYIKSFNVKD